MGAEGTAGIANRLPVTSHTVVIAGLVIAVNVLVAFGGVALLQGKLEGPNFLAIATGLFGLIGGGALGYTTTRGPQRATDTPGAATATASVTTT